jgi:hypothetical protein
MLVGQRVILFWYCTCWFKFVLHSMYHKNTFTTLSGCFGDNLRVLLALKNYISLPNLSTWWNLILCVTDVIYRQFNIICLWMIAQLLAYLIYSFNFCDSPERNTTCLFYLLMSIKLFWLQCKIHFWIFHPC